MAHISKRNFPFMKEENKINRNISSTPATESITSENESQSPSSTSSSTKVRRQDSSSNHDSYISAGTSSTDYSQHSNQMIENYDVTTSRLRSNRHSNPNQMESSSSIVSELSATSGITSSVTAATISAEIEKSIAKGKDDNTCAESIVEPMEARTPVKPRISIPINDDDNEDKIHRKRKIEFRRAVTKAHQSRVEARNIIFNVTKMSPILATVSEGMDECSSTTTSGQFNTEIEEEPPHNDDKSTDSPIITTPDDDNNQSSSRSFLRLWTNKRSRAGSRDDEDKIDFGCMGRLIPGYSSYSSDQIKESEENNHTDPTSTTIDDTKNSSIPSDYERNTTPGITISNNHVNKKSMTFSDTKSPNMGSDYERATTPGIVMELTGNITKDEPGVGYTRPSLIEELSGNITKDEYNDHQNTEPVPVTAYYVEQETRSKFMEFNSAINNYGQYNNNGNLHIQSRTSSPNTRKKTRTPFLRRVFQIVPESSTPSNDIENNTPNQLRQTTLLSPNDNLHDSSQRSGVNNNDAITVNSTPSSHPPTWQNEPVYAVVATPVPSSRSLEGGTPTVSRRRRKRNPFKDRRVMTVLFVAIVLIITLIIGFIILSRRISFIAKPIKPIRVPISSPTPAPTLTRNITPPTPSPVSPVPPATPVTAPSNPTEPPPVVIIPTITNVNGDFNFSTPIARNTDFQAVDGCMFNVRVKPFCGFTNPKFRLTSMDVLLNDTKGQVPIEIYTRIGGYKGFENIRTGWKSVLGSESVWLKGNGASRFTPMKPNFFASSGGNTIWFWEGQTRAFYVTVAEHGRDSLLAQNGFMEEQSYLENSDLEITDGVCFAYPFNAGNIAADSMIPMRWLGSIMYTETIASQLLCGP